MIPTVFAIFIATHGAASGFQPLEVNGSAKLFTDEAKCQLAAFEVEKRLEARRLGTAICLPIGFGEQN